MFKNLRSTKTKGLNHSGRSFVGETLQIEGDLRSSGAVDVAGAAEVHYVNEYMGISYKVSDNLSVSYNEAESRRSHTGTSAAVTQDWDSISLSYTMGGMTIGVVDQEVDNSTYTTARTSGETAIQMTVAF